MPVTGDGKKSYVPASHCEVLIVGGGMAGLSAAIYLGRAMRTHSIIDASESLALWEPEVQNYLGFPEAISGKELLERGRTQACTFGTTFIHDEVIEAEKIGSTCFRFRGRKGTYEASKALIATGLYHLPPKIPAVDECLGKSMFFCKDCDGYRVQNQDVAILGANEEAVEYALNLLAFTPCVFVLTNGSKPTWSKKHQRWLEEYEIPVGLAKITDVEHKKGHLRKIHFVDGKSVEVTSLFTTRGDVYHHKLAKSLGAALDKEGQIKVDSDQQTTVPGLYAAGCVTAANCQMIIAAGAGAAAAQAINRKLFEESLKNHKLRRMRKEQLQQEETKPAVKQEKRK